MDEKQTAALREVFEQKFAHMPLRRGELKPDSYWTPTTACAWEGFLACYQHLAPMVEDSDRYRWLVESSGLDLRTLLGIDDFTSLAAFIDQKSAAREQEKKTC